MNRFTPEQVAVQNAQLKALVSNTAGLSWLAEPEGRESPVSSPHAFP